jgi:hypothetical protein
MAGSAVAGKSDKKAPNLWKEAHDALRDDEKGKERLDKLSGILREQLGKPRLKLRSEDGYKQLQVLIKQKSHNLSAKKSSEKIGKIADNMLAIKDIVAAGTGMGGPYVAIPAAALFLAFSVCANEAATRRAKGTHQCLDAADLSVRERRNVRAG